MLADRRVFIAGLGSGGSQIALESAKTGISCFDLMDHDRFEVGNAARHVAGLSHVGRYKTNIMADLIHDKNPYAEVRIKTNKGNLGYYRYCQRIRDSIGHHDLCHG